MNSKYACTLHEIIQFTYMYMCSTYLHVHVKCTRFSKTVILFRLKEFSFKYRHFTLELPKPMLLADVAIRLMYLPYDALSPQCNTYSCPEEHNENKETFKEDSVIEDEVMVADEEEVKDNDTESVVIASRNTSRIGSSKVSTDDVLYVP